MVTGAGFVVRIPAAMYEEMVAHIVAGYPNAAEHKDDFSEIDAQDLLRIYLDIEEYDGEMYSYYHSHPKSEAYPSRRDIEWAKRNQLYYIIFPHQYYPEPPYARVFLIQDDDTVVEGKIEITQSKVLEQITTLVP